jgi:hypothetical protein
MANSLSRNEKLFLQDQPIDTHLTVPNSSGSSTLAIANYCPHVSFVPTPNSALLQSRSKTGTRTARRGVAGRSFTSWQGTLEMIGAATAAAPPSKSLWRSLFGSAGAAVTGSGSVTGATNASPIVITQTGHGKNTGDVARISAVGGNTAANGVWVIEKVTNDTYKLLGSTGNAAYTSGGTASFVGTQYTLTDDLLTFVAALYRTPSTRRRSISGRTSRKPSSPARVSTNSTRTRSAAIRPNCKRASRPSRLSRPVLCRPTPASSPDSPGGASSTAQPSTGSGLQPSTLAPARKWSRPTSAASRPTRSRRTNAWSRPRSI